jgi:WD40 repeat protein
VNQFCVLDKVFTMALSIHSRIIAVRLDTSLDFWDISSSDPKMIKSYEVTESSISFLSLPPDRRLNVHQDLSGTIEVSEASTGVSFGKYLNRFGESSHDGTFLADTTNYHPVIKVFSDPSAPSLRREWQSAPDKVEFLVDDNIALSYGRKMVTKRWNVVEGCTEIAKDCVGAVKFSPDGKFVLLQVNKGDKFQVWDRAMTHLLATFVHMVDIAFVPRIDHLATLSLLGELQFLEWDAEGRKFKPTGGFKVHDVVFKVVPMIRPLIASSLYLLPSGHDAIVNVNVTNDGYNWKGICQLWNLEEKTKVNATLSSNICDIKISPGSDFFGVDYRKGRQARLFHMSNGAEVHDCNLCGYTSLTFHPVNHIFAVRSGDRENVAIWKGLPWIKKFLLDAPQGQWITAFTLSATSRLEVLSTPERPYTSAVDIWDTATKQKIASQILEFPGYVNSFTFSTDENFLETNRGRIPVPIQHTTKERLEYQWEGIPDCLYVLDKWICQGRKRLIWLPSTYRPRLATTKNLDVRGEMVALAHMDNSVVFIGVSLEKTSVAKMYLALDPGKV